MYLKRTRTAISKRFRILKGFFTINHYKKKEEEEDSFCDNFRHNRVYSSSDYYINDNIKFKNEDELDLVLYANEIVGIIDKAVDNIWDDDRESYNDPIDTVVDSIIIFPF